MDPSLAGAIAGFVGAHANNALQELLKPSLKIGGEAVRDRFLRWKADNLTTVVEKATSYARSSGHVLGAVPGRVLFETLEHCSVEEDPLLQEKWAALLAQAASPNGWNTVLPAFPEILRQLTPVHVRILDWIFVNAKQASDLDPHLASWREVSWEEVSHRFGLNRADYQIIAADLHRLQVIDGRRETQTVYGGKGLSGASTYEVIGLTPLGIAFVGACTPRTEIAPDRSC